ncbi:AAA family ATPase [Candidatus Poribacteria bacterium]|nr:AAA family ATPase [Candidatus Poribacteria bacterium]
MIQRLEVVGLNYQFDYGLKFNPDLNIFTGSNGCGKTTLLKLMWYLISGNLHRIITEIPFEFVLIETDQFSFSMASSNDHKNRGDTLHLVWKFGTGEEKSAQIRRSRFLRNQTVLSLNARIASVSQNSLFFPTFRRIEGGYSHFSRFVERLLVLSQLSVEG